MAQTTEATEGDLLAALRKDRPGPFAPDACATACELAVALGVNNAPAVDRASAMQRSGRCTQMCAPRRAIRGTIPGDR
jgi:hypothetical protein